jgi:transposase
LQGTHNFGATRVRGKRGRGSFGKTVVFGIKKRNDRVYTQIVKNCSASELAPIIAEHALCASTICSDECSAIELVPIIRLHTTTDSTIYSDEWKAYDGLVNMGYKRHYRVKL